MYCSKYMYSLVPRPSCLQNYAINCQLATYNYSWERKLATYSVILETTRPGNEAINTHVAKGRTATPAWSCLNWPDQKFRGSQPCMRDKDTLKWTTLLLGLLREELQRVLSIKACISPYFRLTFRSYSIECVCLVCVRKRVYMVMLNS